LHRLDPQQRLGLGLGGPGAHLVDGHAAHGGRAALAGGGTLAGGGGHRSHSAALTMAPGKMTAVKRSEMMIGDSVKVRKPSTYKGASSSSGGDAAVLVSGSALDLFSLSSSSSGALWGDASSGHPGNNRARGGSGDAGADFSDSSSFSRTKPPPQPGKLADLRSGSSRSDAGSLDGDAQGAGPGGSSGSADGGLENGGRSGVGGGGGQGSGGGGGATSGGDGGSRDGSDQWSESGSRGGGHDRDGGFGSDGDDDEGDDDDPDGDHLSSFRRGRRGAEDHSQQFIRDFSERALAQQVYACGVMAVGHLGGCGGWPAHP
jgi:hypothetical protein